MRVSPAFFVRFPFVFLDRQNRCSPGQKSGQDLGRKEVLDLPHAPTCPAVAATGKVLSALPEKKKEEGEGEAPRLFDWVGEELRGRTTEESRGERNKE